MHHHRHHGAKMERRFDPAHAARLDDPARFVYLPVAEVLTFLDLPPNATLLDFGAGTGTYAIEIARARPDAHVVALDEQAEMLAFLRSKLAGGGPANVEPLHTAALTDTRLHADRILALNVLHELGDEVLAEVHAMLAPQGKVAVIDWNAAVERDVGPPADVVYAPAEACERLEQHGFLVVDERSFPYHYALLAVRG